ncbi:MAG: hypothetical protein LQ338_001390 [Usnochroma carphineum]|nr:MAG: hypothetical protein LQ338_001390 [Usnochroma carphineum]
MPNRGLLSHHLASAQAKASVEIAYSTEATLSGQVMQETSRHVGNRSDQNTAATLGLENLELGSKKSEIPTCQMPKKGKKGIKDTSKTTPWDAPSKVNARSWRREQQVPTYQPLNVPALGSNQNAKTLPGEDTAELLDHTSNLPLRASQQTATYAAKELLALTPSPTSSSLNQKAKQYSIDRAGQSIPARGRDTFDRRAKQYSNAQTRPNVPPPGPAQPPLGRWFGSVPTPQLKPRFPKLASPDPEHNVKPPPTPVPDPSYTAQSAIPATQLTCPQPLLLVLDLNGTLLYRSRASSNHRPRPSLQPFLTHCMSNYRVLIWSSATPPNVTTICSKIFTPKERKLLLGEWGRDTLGLTAQQYGAKVQVFKRLDRIWATDKIQRSHPDFANGGRWSQTNTLLLDDSVLKASAQPYNAVVVPEFLKEGDADGTEILGQVVAYLERARIYDNVSSFVREQPFRVNGGWECMWDQKERGTRANNSGSTGSAPSPAMTRGRAPHEGQAQGTAVVDFTAGSDEETGGVTL